MKAIVEFGRPKSALANAPCGVSGQFVCESVAKATELALQLRHVLSARAPFDFSAPARYFKVSRINPRVTWWSHKRDSWIAVSILDGVPRGGYGALADKEA